MKKMYITIFVALITLVSVQAQDPFLQKGDIEKDEQAREMVKLYDAELALRAEQRARMAIKIEEYLIKREEVKNSRRTEKGKLEALYELQKAEEAAMRDILTGNQYPLYLKIKPKIQPLKVVQQDKDMKNKSSKENLTKEKNKMMKSKSTKQVEKKEKDY